jgi:hypothetical protein
MALKFLRIMKVENEPGKPEKVPGMVGPAWVRKISLTEAKTLIGLEGLEGFAAILALALCDESGTPVTVAEVDDLPFNAAGALAKIASEYNGLAASAQAELEKNSETGQIEG